jgi:hypothetical protein
MAYIFQYPPEVLTLKSCKTQFIKALKCERLMLANNYISGQINAKSLQTFLTPKDYLLSASDVDIQKLANKSILR